MKHQLESKIYDGLLLIQDCIKDDPDNIKYYKGVEKLLVQADKLLAVMEIINADDLAAVIND